MEAKAVGQPAVGTKAAVELEEALKAAATTEVAASVAEDMAEEPWEVVAMVAEATAATQATEEEAPTAARLAALTDHSAAMAAQAGTAEPAVATAEAAEVVPRTPVPSAPTCLCKCLSAKEAAAMEAMATRVVVAAQAADPEVPSEEWMEAQKAELMAEASLVAAS